MINKRRLERDLGGYKAELIRLNLHKRELIMDWQTKRLIDNRIEVIKAKIYEIEEALANE